MPLNALSASLVRKFWALFVILLLMLAVYVSVGRMVMPRLVNYQPQLEEMLSNALGLEVSAEVLKGGWQGLSPTATLQQVSLISSGGEDLSGSQRTVLEIEQLNVQLDVLSSLLSRKVIFSSFHLQGSALDLEELEDGRWRMPGLPEREPRKESDPIGLLLSQNDILLTNISLTLHPQALEARTLNIPSWGLRCGLMVCASQGSISWQIDEEHELNFSLNIYGKPDEEDFRLEGYLATAPVQVTDWLPLINIDDDLINDVKGILVGGEVWFDWFSGQLQDVRGTLDIPQIDLGSQHAAMTAIDFLHTDFSWLRDTGQEDELQALWLNNLTFKYAGKLFEPANRRISLLQRGEDRIARLIADHISLEPIVSTLLALDSLPKKIRDPLKTLSPSGELENLQVEYRLPGEGEEGQKPWFKIESHLQNVSVSPWRHVPGIKRVTGYLEVEPERGQVDFASQNFQLHFPRVFLDSWSFDKASGVVSWVREGRTFWLTGQDLEMSGEIGEVTGRFRSVSSKDGLEPRLSLLIGLENSHLPKALTLLPDVVASPKLVSWLDQAFADGDVKSTRFVLDQKVKKGSKPITRTLAMDVDASKVDFSFHPDWPNLDEASVNVQIRDQQVTVQAKSARWFDATLNNIDAFYDGTKGAQRLTGSAKVSGPLQDAWRALTDTPLRKNLFGLGHDFQFAGDLSDGRLMLDIPFNKPEKTDVKLSFSTRNASLKIPPVNLEASSITGGFSYSSLEGLIAPKVSASIFGENTDINIDSRKNAGELLTKLTAKGRVSMPLLAPWLPATTLAMLEGETAYQALLSVGKGSDNSFTVRSDLKGVKVALPAPIGKGEDEKADLLFKTSLAGKQIHELRYADKFAYALSFMDGGYQDGQITLGGGTAEFVEGAGIEARGALAELDFKEWQRVLERANDGDGKEADDRKAGGTQRPQNWALLSRINKVQLDVDRFRFLENDYEQVIFNASQDKGDWLIGFDNAEAQGELSYFYDPEKPLSVHFNYLYAPVGEEPIEEVAAQVEAPDQDPLVDVTPQDLPELDVSIDTLYLQGEPFGRWAFKLRPETEGVSFDSLDFELRGVQGKGKVYWRQDNGSHHSEFTGNIRIPDAAAMLTAWEKPAAIEGKNAKLSGTLNWAGSPAKFSLLNVEGLVKLRAKQGRIVDMTSIRLLGVLNFNSLSRRLRLDFSDLFKKGFSFDRAEGKLRFDQGQMTMAESLIIDGPSAKFKIDGRTDLVNEQFDQDVIVVLPVKDNIPVIAALAGFPQVGVPLYLFNRAFGDTLDRFTSANYRVTGSWDDPDVKLASFFDSQNLPKSSSSPGKKQGRGRK